MYSFNKKSLNNNRVSGIVTVCKGEKRPYPSLILTLGKTGKHEGCPPLP